MAQGTTDKEFESIIQNCRDIFMKKTADYGTSWRVFRPISVADQLYIKAKRIRNIQNGAVPLVNEDWRDGFKSIINYSIIGVLQNMIEGDEWELSVDEVSPLYDQVAQQAYDLLQKKNHDYGEAWRELSIKGITDLILAKILRIRKMVQNDGKTITSEGVDSNFLDILIYAVFCLILAGNQ